MPLRAEHEVDELPRLLRRRDGRKEDQRPREDIGTRPDVAWLGREAADRQRSDAWTREGRTDRADPVRLGQERRDLVQLPVDLLAVLAVRRAVHGMVLELHHLRATGAPDLGNANNARIRSPEVIPARDPPGIDGLQLVLGEAGDRIAVMDEHTDRVVADDLVVDAPLLLGQGQWP